MLLPGVLPYLPLLRTLESDAPRICRV
jgi:hypothetical protein